jgi:hypothetical protein
VFFPRYTPPEKTDLNLFFALRGEKSEGEPSELPLRFSIRPRGGLYIFTFRFSFSAFIDAFPPLW